MIGEMQNHAHSIQLVKNMNAYHQENWNKSQSINYEQQNYAKLPPQAESVNNINMIIERENKKIMINDVHAKSQQQMKSEQINEENSMEQANDSVQEDDDISKIDEFKDIDQILGDEE